MKHSEVTELFENYVLQTYGRFPLTFVKARANTSGTARQTLSRHGRGIAVNILGHAHPDLQKALSEQSQTLALLNLYQHPLQGELAEALVHRIGDGKIFFPIVALNRMKAFTSWQEGMGMPRGVTRSLHSSNRSMVTCRDRCHRPGKSSGGFWPLGFRNLHAVFNDLRSVEEGSALQRLLSCWKVFKVRWHSSSHTGSSEARGYAIHPVAPAMGWCAMWPSHWVFRSFQSLLPSGGGHVVSPGCHFDGKIWVVDFQLGLSGSANLFNIAGAGSHGTTYGGNPLACSVASRILQLIQEQSLIKTH